MVSNLVLYLVITNQLEYALDITDFLPNTDSKLTAESYHELAYGE